MQDNDEQQSETAIVDVTVENAIPEISEVQVPDTITEGVEVSLNAIATDAGNGVQPRYVRDHATSYSNY